MNSELLDTYPKYDSYKDSGIKELGKVPKDWELLSNKHIFSIKNIRVGKKSEDYDLLSLTLKGIVKRDMDNPQGKFPAEFDTYQEVSSGDFVFCLFDVEETPRTVGLSEFDGMITGAYTVLEVSTSFDKNFIYYFYLNLDNEKMLKPLYRGLRNTIPKDWFMSYKTFIPTYEEQTAIANFLDQKTTQIDQAINLKQQQIEKLNDYKQIVIQNAVTKGLNPNTKMKDSGVEWIGEIPEHWELKKVKFIGSISSGDSITNNDLKSSGVYEVFGGNGFMGYYDNFNVQKQSIIIGRVGALCGNIRYINEKKWISDNALILKINDKYLYNYVALVLEAADLNRLNTSSAQPLITATKVNNVELPLPPLSEIDSIYAHSKLFLENYSKTQLVLSKQIERLKEYKTILINQAVTGKIKVS